MHLAIDATNIRQGGGVTHLSQLLNVASLEGSGISSVTVWSCDRTLAQLPTKQWLKKKSCKWIEARLVLRFLGQQLLFNREILKNGCDVLFSPGGTIPFLIKTPVVTMSQNMLPFEPAEALRFGRWSLMRFKMWLLRQSQSRSFRRADGLVFLTQYAKTAISNALGNILKLNSLIPHGIESRFLQPPRPARNISDCSFETPFRLLYVSILMPYKHQVEVALAISHLRKEGWPVEMKFIGPIWGHYGKKFTDLLGELDPQGKFLQWTGEESFEALHNSYINAEAFVYASSCENLPNILIEAMAAGLPIACSNRGPMPEVLGNAGVFFDPESPDSIADTLRELVNNSYLRMSLAELAWQKAQTYSWERCAKDTFEFIAHVAKHHVRA